MRHDLLVRGLLASVLALLLGTACDKFPVRPFAVYNSTSLAILVSTNDTLEGRWGPNITKTRSMGVAPRRVEGPPSYTFRAYVFVPEKPIPGLGSGRISWGFDEGGGLIQGGAGELIYCATYTWSELKELGWRLTIVRNVGEGRSYESDPPSQEPCR